MVATVAILLVKAGDLETTMFPSAWDCGYQQGLTFADLNNDGLPDLIAGSDSYGICIRLGNGDGTFGPIVHTDFGCQAFPVTADFDGDGDLDVVTANFWWEEGGAPNFIRMLGNGDGTLGAALYVDAGDQTWGVAVGDFNEDDAPDVLTASYEQGVGLHFGTGDGQFLPHEILTPAHGSWWVLVDEFDGDGHDDFASLVWSGQPHVRISLGNGDGAFALAGTPEVSGFGRMESGDLNDDGIPDLVVTGGWENDTLSVLIGNGDGTFQPVQAHPVAGIPLATAMGDVDGDGWADVIVGHHDPTAHHLTTLLRGTGGGSLATAESIRIPSSYYPDQLLILDLDQDGDNDIVRSASLSGSTLLQNRGDGTFPGIVATDVDSSASRMRAGDVDGDGLADLVVWPQPPQLGPIGVLLGTGDGLFVQADELAAGGTHSAVVTGEFGQGGFEDVASADEQSNEVRTYPGLGGGAFGPGTSWAVGIQPRALVAGDLDGDDLVDLVTANRGSNDLSVLLQESNGFAPETRFATGPRPVSLGLGRLDGDADLDLVAASESSGDFSVHLGAGDGTFAPPTSYPLEDPQLVPISVTLVDLTADGDLDVLIFAKKSSQKGTWLFPGVGDGTFLEGIELLPLSILNGAPPTVADIDGDGRTDLLNGNQLWRGDVDGTLQPPFEIGWYDSSTTAADFDGDGRTDLARFDQVSGLSEVWVLLIECLGADMRLTASDHGFDWRGMCGAQSYNVYRRDFASGLSDANEDGLPDAGYGECINDLDDDTTDTLLDDQEIPLPGGSGFAYLVSWIDLGGERGLGATSTGLPREVTLSCP